MALVQPEIYAAIHTLLAGRERAALCVVVHVEGSVPGKLGAKMLVYGDGRQLGTVGGAGLEERVRSQALEALRTGRGGTAKYTLSKWVPGGLNSLCGGHVEVYVEVLIPGPHLLLCGGGHVAQAIAQQCDLLGYRYAVLDDRPAYVDAGKFPAATARYLGSPEELFPGQVPVESYSDIYLLGYSWELDLALLAHLLPRATGYIGAVGSRTKGESLRRELAGLGMAPEQLARLACPIGLTIGAESPSEIAVAVMAELIQRTKQPPEAPA